MIPEGWKKKSLEEVAEIRTGLAKGKKTNDAVVHRPYLRVANVQDGYLDLRSMKDIEVREKDVGRYSLEVGDVVLTEGGDFNKLGRGAVWRGQVAGCLHQNHVFAVRTVRSKLLPDFFSAQSASHYGKSYYLSCAKRSTNLASINSTQLKQFPVLLPPLQEQRKITETLETWDSAIETVEALIANARAQKRALMQQLLGGKHRLPGFSGEWHRKPINEIATRITRRNDGTELPVLTISSTSGFVRQDEKYSRFMAGKSVDTYIVLNEGEFAYNKGNSKTYEFGCIFDLEGYARALVPHVYVCFKLKTGYSHRFYKALFEADYLAPQLGQLVNTGVRNNGLLNIKPSEFLGTKVPVPPLEEQDAIAAVMEAASRTVIEHDTQLTALRQEKAALMQQLLTGKRRVKLPESEVA